MNNTSKRFRSLGLALVMCLALTGCAASPASAKAVNLDKPTTATVSLKSGDTLRTTGGNMYEIDQANGGTVYVHSSNTMIASVAVDKDTGRVMLMASMPGTADVTVINGNESATYKVLVR